MSGGHVVDDLGAYLLGTLSGEEEREVRVHLEACATCRSELARIQGAAELLDSARLAEEPPVDLEERILRAAGRAPRTPRRRRVVTLAWTILLAAAAFTGGVALGRLSPAATRPDQEVTLRGPGAATGTARVYVLSTGARRVELHVKGMPQLPAKVAWAVALQDKAGERRSAGTFFAESDGSARVTLTVAGSSADYTTLVVTRTDDAAGAPWTLAATLQP